MTGLGRLGHKRIDETIADEAGGVLVLVGGAVGEGITRERHTWAEDNTP